MLRLWFVGGRLSVITDEEALHMLEHGRRIRPAEGVVKLTQALRDELKSTPSDGKMSA